MTKTLFTIVGVVVLVVLGIVTFQGGDGGGTSNANIHTNTPTTNTPTNISQDALLYPLQMLIDDYDAEALQVGSWYTEGIVRGWQDCPPCPRGAVCAPCPPDGIRVGVSGDDRIAEFATDDFASFLIGEQYRFAFTVEGPTDWLQLDAAQLVQE